MIFSLCKIIVMCSSVAYCLLTLKNFDTFYPVAWDRAAPEVQETRLCCPWKKNSLVSYSLVFQFHLPMIWWLSLVTSHFHKVLLLLLVAVVGWKVLQESSSPASCSELGQLWNQTVFLSVWYNCVLKTSPDGACTVSPGSLFQWLTVLMGKTFLLLLFSRILTF